MKKIIKNLLIGFCVGVTVVSFSIIISEIWDGDFEEGFLEEVGMWLMLSTWCGISIGIGITIGEKNKGKDNIYKKMILRHSLVVIFLLTILLTVFLIVSIVNNFGMIFTAIIFAMILALLLWAFGAYLGYKSLKKDVDSINKKLQK